MKFRKKPVVIEAWMIPAEGMPPIEPPPIWLQAALMQGECIIVPGGGLDIRTLEGDMRGNVGDFVIRGVKGELYPCKPDIFAVSYEPSEGVKHD
jgi:hypothetical protein